MCENCWCNTPYSYILHTLHADNDNAGMGMIRRNVFFTRNTKYLRSFHHRSLAIDNRDFLWTLRVNATISISCSALRFYFLALCGRPLVSSLQRALKWAVSSSVRDTARRSGECAVQTNGGSTQKFKRKGTWYQWRKLWRPTGKEYSLVRGQKPG